MLAASEWIPNGIKDSQKPRIVNTVDEFIQEGFYGCHMDDVIVLPNGVHKMRMQDDLPDYLSNLKNFPTVSDLLSSVSAKILEELDARVYYFNQGREREAKNKDAKGNYLDTLGEKWAELRHESKEGIDHANLYLTELRHARKHKYRHAIDGDWARTVMKTDVKDLVGKKARVMPYWDRYNEGVFIGGKFSGSPLHMDQCLWSNFGKNFTGYKLFAIWPYGAETLERMEPHFRELFYPPLTKEQQDVLSTASKLVLVSPGDAFIFSGANLHMAITISDELSLTAYESFVNLHERHLHVLCDSNQEPQHHEEFHMSSKTLVDVKWDVIDALNDNLDRIDTGVLSEEDENLICSAANALRSRDVFYAEEIRQPKRRKEVSAVETHKPANDQMPTPARNN
jgi:hypothetical protein